jgi:quinol-cytochrome oxidoreductase complex cytochrome b subunit
MTDAIRRQSHQRTGLYSWFQERLNIDTLWRALFIRKIPFGVNLPYTLAFASLTLFLVQMFTGTPLALYYSPSPDHDAYDSVEYRISQVPLGQVLRILRARCFNCRLRGRGHREAERQYRY